MSTGVRVRREGRQRGRRDGGGGDLARSDLAREIAGAELRVTSGLGEGDLRRVRVKDRARVKARARVRLRLRAT